jgi:hypothetical protein
MSKGNIHRDLVQFAHDPGLRRQYIRCSRRLEAENSGQDEGINQVNYMATQHFCCESESSVRDAGIPIAIPGVFEAFRQI